MQFIDLKKQYSLIKKDVNNRIKAVLDHGQYIMGPEIAELEQSLASYVDVKHCISCSSGTDALLMPLMAWDIGPGDAVFTTSFTYIATAEVISLLGATPVFVDIDINTFNICPDELDKAIKKILKNKKLKPKAIIPVDLFGLLANYKKIEKIASKYNLFLLEDAAQSFGSTLDMKKAGSFGDAASTSFFPAKPLGCYGDGGAVFTNDDSLAEKIKSIRIHGMGKNKYTNVRIGLNARLDSIQAAVLMSKLSIFDLEIEKRNNIAKQYISFLNKDFSTQKIPEGFLSVWAQFSILAFDENQREDVIKKLNNNSVPSFIYYPIPLHLQKAFRYLDYKEGDLPIAESISKKIFSIPMHPYLEENTILNICDLISSI